MSQINPKDAVDLAAVKQRADAAEVAAAAERARREEAAIEQAAQEWERAMKRAFKGIHPHSQRKRDLLRMARKDQR